MLTDPIINSLSQLDLAVGRMNQISLNQYFTGECVKLSRGFCLLNNKHFANRAFHSDDARKFQLELLLVRFSILLSVCPHVNVSKLNNYEQDNFRRLTRKVLDSISQERFKRYFIKDINDFLSRLC